MDGVARSGPYKSGVPWSEGKGSGNLRFRLLLSRIPGKIQAQILERGSTDMDSAEVVDKSPEAIRTSSDTCILLTSVGRRVELIEHFLSYADSARGVRVLGTEIDRYAPAAQLLGSDLRIVPRTDSPDYGEVMEKLCRDENVTAVYPLIDPDVRRLANVDVPLASVAAKMAAVVSDKWLTYEWLRSIAAPTVDSWLPSQLLPSHELEYPLFIKPRQGSGGIDAFRIDNSSELEYLRKKIPNPIIQKHIPGAEVTIDVIVDRRSRLLAVVQRQRLDVRGGEVTRGRIIYDPHIHNVVLGIVREARPSGPITIQGMYDRSGEFLVTEVNARLGGGVPLAIAGGLPLAQVLVKSFTEDVAPLDPEAIKVGLEMTRFDRSMFFRPSVS